VDAFLVDSWLLVIGLRMLLRRNLRRSSQRLKSRRIQRKCSRNLRLKKIQKKWRWKKNQWSRHSCMMTLFWKLMLTVTCDPTITCGSR
jgi:hypothetical protein